MEGFLSPGLRLAFGLALPGRCWVIEDSLASSGGAGEKLREAAVLPPCLLVCVLKGR